MLRPDFPDIIDYISRNSSSYTVNTNGTLITPKIAKLMKRKGVKLVSLYGATAEVHDHITRSPGSFDALMRGIAYLREDRVWFTIQVIPLKDNYGQLKDMVKLAKSLSGNYRIGVNWLYLSASRNAQRNTQIKSQRLSAEVVFSLNTPDISYNDWLLSTGQDSCRKKDDEFMFSGCVRESNSFHVDAYGKMSFCYFIKIPKLRYDLIGGSFRRCWEEFFPSLVVKFRFGRKYKNGCGVCQLRQYCQICPAYAYLEHGDFNSKVDYLCPIARKKRDFERRWKKEHRRYYNIAGVTIEVNSDEPISDSVFEAKFRKFEVNDPGDDMISIHHHFSSPNLMEYLGRECYNIPPWKIYENNGFWVYLESDSKRLCKVAVFNHDHTRVRIYHLDSNVLPKMSGHSLTLFPTDQILIARILADREAFYLHSCGVIFEGKGMLFVGHSGSGKSTMASMLKGEAEILCDDRIIVRRYRAGFRIHGTWSHGDVAEVSANSSGLAAVMFLRKAKRNRLIPVKDRKQIIGRMLPCIIRPFVCRDWWGKILPLVDAISENVDFYVMEFDKSGKILDELRKL